MRSRTLIAITTLFILATAAGAQKLKVDADKKADFKTFKTYGWSEGQIAPSAATGYLIVEAVERELNSRGLVRDNENPDLRIAVMAAADMDIHGVGPSWNNANYKSWGGYSNPAALMNLHQGTLLIDLIDKDKFSIWRGVAKNVFIAQSNGDPAKDAKHMKDVVDKTVGKLFKKYPVNPHN